MAKDVETVIVQSRESFPEYSKTLSTLSQQWVELSMNLGGKAMENLEEVGSASTDYLFFSGYVVLATMWLKIACAAQGHADHSFAQSKVDIARFYFQRLLPRAQAHAVALASGAETLMDVAPEAFAAS